MNSTSAMSAECPSLNQPGLTLSTNNTTEGTIVKFGCEEFGHKPSEGIRAVTCLSTGNWSKLIPVCKWSWHFNTQEKVIFGTLVAAVSFIIIIFITIMTAYFCRYKKHKEEQAAVQDNRSSGHSTSGTLDVPWLGYIPRPKVSKGHFYKQ